MVADEDHGTGRGQDGGVEDVDSAEEDLEDVAEDRADDCKGVQGEPNIKGGEREGKQFLKLRRASSSSSSSSSAAQQLSSSEAQQPISSRCKDSLRTV